jgi:hypothetical protein
MDGGEQREGNDLKNRTKQKLYFRNKNFWRETDNLIKILVKIGEIKMMNADCILHAALEDDKEMVRKIFFLQNSKKSNEERNKKGGWIRQWLRLLTICYEHWVTVCTRCLSLKSFSIVFSSLCMVDSWTRGGQMEIQPWGFEIVFVCVRVL